MPKRPPVFKPPASRSLDQRRADADRSRGSSSARGYDRAWKALRVEFLAQHPLCECEVHQGKDVRAVSDVVDHVVPIAEAPHLRLEWSNLRAMSKSCHDRHTAKTTGFGR